MINRKVNFYTPQKVTINTFCRRMNMYHFIILSIFYLLLIYLPAPKALPLPLRLTSLLRTAISICFAISTEATRSTHQSNTFLVVICTFFLQYHKCHPYHCLHLVNRLPNIIPHILISKFNPLRRPIRILPRQL